MNRHHSIILAAALLLTASCGKVEREQYSGTFSRIVTVQQSGDAVSMRMDCTKDVIQIKNFQKTEDMKAFGANPGDRGVARISYNAIPSANLTTNMLESFTKFTFSRLNWSERPQSKLASYFYFTNFSMGDVVYPFIWSAGHHINTTIGFYPDPSIPDKDNTIELYPVGLRKDTLSMLLVSNFPGTCHQYSVREVFLDYDLSEIAAVDDIRANELYQSMMALGKDSIYVEIATCDSLQLIDGSQLRKVKGGKLVTRFAFDF